MEPLKCQGLFDEGSRNCAFQVDYFCIIIMSVESELGGYVSNKAIHYPTVVPGMYHVPRRPTHQAIKDKGQLTFYRYGVTMQLALSSVKASSCIRYKFRVPAMPNEDKGATRSANLLSVCSLQKPLASSCGLLVGSGH